MSSLALTGIAKNSSMVALPSFLSSTGDCAYGSFFDLAIQLCKTIMEIAMFGIFFAGIIDMSDR
jgi:hypothetical protein